MPSKYEELGVDPGKQSVRATFAKQNDNEYPGAFVNIITDPFCEGRALTQHQDGDGSKFVQRMIHYLETGDENVFVGMADDALSMNSGDIAASGFVSGPWLITDVLNLNLPKKLKKIVMEAVATRLIELRELYKEHGFDPKFLGGETADLPDQVKSGVFDIAITAWADKSDLIVGNVEVGDIIFGFASDGQAAWEQEPNSGIMSNGLTLARSCLMDKSYNEKYPHLKRDGDFYTGRFTHDEHLIALNHMSVGDALLSPTRQWAIVIKTLISILKEKNALHMLHGISMNTGGGATKISHVGSGGLIYVKDMPTPPPLFLLIQKESGENWKDMYHDFNCGIGIDVVGENNNIFRESIVETSKRCRINQYHLGKVLKGEGESNQVCLHTPYGDFKY